jgi:hypothetical protein
MRKYLFVSIGIVAFIAAIGLVTAGYGSGNGECDQQSFVDDDGDGVCDNWVDVDEDGVNDNCDGSGRLYKNSGGQGKGYGPGDGTGYHGNCPRDGSGFGPGYCNCQE